MEVVRLDLLKHAEKLLMRLSRSRRFDGLWLGVIGDKDDDPLLDRVQEALILIKQYDEPRYRRLLRDLDRIWIHVLAGAQGSFSAAFRRCDLDYRFVATSPAEAIASTIVHEAAHAHPLLSKLGYAENVRHRIEQICMRQELAFASRIPDGSNVREQVESSLMLPPTCWSSAALEKHRSAGELAAARYVGLPDWLTHALLALRATRSRLRRIVT